MKKKNYLLYWILPLAVNLSATRPALGAPLALEVLNYGVQIQDNREAITIWGRARGDQDEFCEEIALRIKYEDPSSYAQVSEAIITVENFFVRGGDDAFVQERVSGQEEFKHLSKDPEKTVLIRSAEMLPDQTKCRTATLEDYCRYGDLSAEEEFERDVILEYLGSRSCRSASQYYSDKSSFSLKRRKLQSVRMLKYFPAITHIKLDGNEIKKVWPLRLAKGLKKLDLESNPVEDLSGLGVMPSLLELDIKYTQVPEMQGIENFPKLWWLDALQTPISTLQRATVHPSLYCLNVDNLETFSADELSALKQNKKKTGRKIGLLLSCGF